jgi:hypothetical protein
MDVIPTTSMAYQQVIMINKYMYNTLIAKIDEATVWVLKSCPDIQAVLS